MEKPKAPFSLHKRPTKTKSRFIYYVQFRDPNGNYTSAQSTGQTSKGAAIAWATEYLKKGHVPTQRGFTFEKFSQGWWIWGECPYIKGRLARGLSISKRYAEESRRNLEKHLLPAFSNRKLTDIRPNDIEEVQALLDEESLSSVWDGDLYHYCINLLAASTGLRIGEIQALLTSVLTRPTSRSATVGRASSG